MLCCHLVIYLYSANKKIIKTLFLRGKFLVRLFHLILSEYCEDPSVVTKIEQRIFLFKGTVSRYVAGLKGFLFNKFIQNKQASTDWNNSWHRGTLVTNNSKRKRRGRRCRGQLEETLVRSTYEVLPARNEQICKSVGLGIYKLR